MNMALVDLGVPQTLLNRLHTLSEQVHVQLFKPCPSNSGIKINTFIKRIDLDCRLSGRRQCPLRSLASRSQPPQSSGITAYVLLVLPLELCHEVIHKPVIKIFTPKMSISRSSLHFKDSFLDCEQRNIERSATEIENQDVLFAGAGGLFVEPISNGRSSGLVDDSHDVKPRNGASVLGGLTLRIVEIGRNSDHRVLYGLTQISFGDFLHLHQHHRRNLFGRELFLFAFVVNDNHWLVARARNDLKWPVTHVALDRRV
ncbi:Glutamate dehydrogenase, NAD-specific [Parasponia andersonii]|uniref:Glutamate dehydrogenase, NAD-specific n=1 Tax=Parasponia andersonii TaxID=3476 RepID=A0A2P5DWV5_PARAD|nr:Glutamate dehydrogenase, NAD-specific [Parasponia andersonii]